MEFNEIKELVIQRRFPVFLLCIWELKIHAHLSLFLAPLPYLTSSFNFATCVKLFIAWFKGVLFSALKDL